MMYQNEGSRPLPSNMPGNDIDLEKYVRLVLKNWKVFAVWCLLGALVGIIIGFSKPKKYTSTAIVAPEILNRSTSGGLSSLANLAGINMNTMALTDAMHPDLYPVIVRSSSFVISLFDMPVEFEHKDTLVHTDLYDYLANYNKTPWWSYIFNAPFVALGWVKDLFVEKDPFDDAEGHDGINLSNLTKQQEMIAKALGQSISASVEKKTYVLSLKVSTQDRHISAALANYIIQKLQDFVTGYRREKNQENVDYYMNLYDETKLDYLNAQKEYARFLDTHQGLVFKSELVAQQHLQNEANLAYQVYNQTAQNLMSAKAKVQLDSPVLVVVQPGTAPHNGKPSKVKLAFIGFVLGFLCCFVRFMRKASKDASSEVSE